MAQPRGKIDVRLGPELRQGVEQFQVENAISGVSAAVRALIALGLERSSQLDEAWRKLAWREGVIAGSTAFKAAYQDAMKTALARGGIE